MNLKEAFRFQNKLQSLLDQAAVFLTDRANITQVETTYLRKKVMPDAENETVVSELPSPYCHQVGEMMEFLLHLLEQKELLSQAIHAAKADLSLDMDSQTSLNGTRQQVAAVFRSMAELRPTESLVPAGGTGYRFNAEGNQVAYRCDVKKVTTIHFDRNLAKKFMARLSRQADAVSVEIDKCLINSTVDYVPPFDVNDSFGDVFEAFVAQK